MVAVYPIRLVLLAIAVCGVTADVRAEKEQKLIWTHKPIQVGYYDMNTGSGGWEQVPPIVAAGLTPVFLTDVTAADLAGLHILFVQNSSGSSYGGEYLARRAEVQAAVAAGLVLIIHDRFVGPSPAMTRMILPLPAGVPFPVVTRMNSNNINVSDPATLVADGPGGIITDTNLDGGNFSNMGAVSLSTLLIEGRKGLLHTGMSANQAITLSYPLGLGFVIYSSIPLDMFLKGGGPQLPRGNFANIYAPNLLAYAACGLKALPATVSVAAATGQYGGTATLSATVQCGVIPVPGVDVEFSLNGTSAGSAQTDASGVATLTNVSLGTSLDEAIAVGAYPDAVSAAFAGTAQYGAGSGTAALTVEKAPATITYTGGEFVYSGAGHAASGSVTGVFGESLGTPSFTYTDQTGATTDAAPVNAGTFGITASSAETASYLATQVSSSGATIVVTPAPLTVTADDKTKVYGAPLPTFTASFDGFVANEDVGVLDGRLSFTTEATVRSTVAEYAIRASGLSSANYAITFVDGTLAVTPAPLKIRAEDKERLVGILNPALTVRYEGFVLGESDTNLDKRPTVTTSASLTTPPGNYPIVVDGAADLNYAIEQVDGTLTLSPEGRISGSGSVDTPGARHHFMFESRETIILGEKGSLSLRVDRETETEADDVFVSQLVTSVIFKDNPDVDPGGKAIADAVTFRGIGTWNGAAATFEVLAADNGEAGVGQDVVTIHVAVDGIIVHTTGGTLNGGNVQSNRVTR